MNSPIRMSCMAVSLCAALFALALVSPHASARSDLAATKDLKSWLQELDKNNGSFRDITMALGYVSGVHDLLSDSDVCAPRNVNARTLAKAVHVWMKAHPDDWEIGAADTVRRALADTYPCKPES
jgi:hypothetical protein